MIHHFDNNYVTVWTNQIGKKPRNLKRRAEKRTDAEHQAMADAFDSPGACLRCGEESCLKNACLDDKKKFLLAWAESISPDHWTSLIMPKREQIGCKSSEIH